MFFGGSSGVRPADRKEGPSHWSRSLQGLGVAAWAIMAPSLTLDGSVQPALRHADQLPWPTEAALSRLRLGGVQRLDDVSWREYEWAADVQRIGYRSAVLCRIPALGMHAYEVVLLGMSEISEESAARAVWLTLTHWPELLRHLFEKRSGLTAREVECLRLVARGLETQEIAEQLKCTARTVRFHVENGMDKLQANRSLQAVLRAMSLGMD